MMSHLQSMFVSRQGRINHLVGEGCTRKSFSSQRCQNLD